MGERHDVEVNDEQWEKIKRDLPERFPSPSTCRRRLTEWEAEGALEQIWHAFLDTLSERGLIDWNEAFVDGTFSPAKKGTPN